MAIRQFQPVFLFACAVSYFVFLSACDKDKDWTYEEIRDRFHGQYNCQYRSDSGNSWEVFEMIEISDSISMIMGKSFDSTYIGISDVDLESGIMRMHGSDLLHLHYTSRYKTFSLTRYEPEEIFVRGNKKPD